MSRGQQSTPGRRRAALFTILLLLTSVFYLTYGVNIVRWRNSPDFGWRTVYETGPNIAAQVLDRGAAAGLRVGDRIVDVNGREYSTFDELYFEVRHGAPGAVNVYTVERDGERLEVAVENGRLGTAAVLARSGIIYAIGFVIFFIGVLVYLMKPSATESLLFFLMTSLLGMEISFGAPSDLIRPLAFFKLRLFNDVFMPAPLIHLSLWFPKKRELLKSTPWVGLLPYLVSAVIFALYIASGKRYWDTPPALDMVNNAYLLLAVVFFLVSTLWNLFGGASAVVRLQSQVIFIGIFFGLFVPAADMILRSFTGKYLFPDPTIGYAVFLTAFPVSIGYTIVKHDLFAIDVIVRRTYGYMLSTGAVVLVYALVVSALNATFQSAEVSRSPYFSLLFALAVVFTFRPLHGRIQALVDRVFYRRRYDYRKTIRTVSEAMTGLLDRAQIQRMLIGSVVEEMFLENGLLLLPEPGGKVYRAQPWQGEGQAEAPARELGVDDPLVRHMREKAGPVMRQEIELNPRYEGDREALSATLDALGSEIVLPLTHKEKIQGIVSLGRKKSGKMFTAEDVDLLNTMANQSAIALENTRLMEENVEKGRMEEELKIAHDLQMSMLPENPPAMAGVRIAARSVPAREVGGDFFDFIEMGEKDAAGRRLGIVVADVSGKAVSGALVMAATRSVFRVLAADFASVRDVMLRSNARLGEDVKKGMFVALLYAVLDPGEKLLTLSSAGQTQPMLFSPGRRPVLIETEGDRFPLGIVAEADYEETKVQLQEGDTLVFYTDGVVEAMNGQEEIYGFDRLTASLEAAGESPAEECLESLMKDVSDFTGGVEQHDDITIMVVKVGGPQREA